MLWDDGSAGQEEEEEAEYEEALTDRPSFPEGTRDWALGRMFVTGQLRPPHSDEFMDLRDQALPLADLKELCTVRAP